MIDPLRALSNIALVPLLDLGIRLFMANIFLKSGWQKFQTYLNDDWASTVYLFQEIHAIPGIPADIAAVAGTGGELLFGALLIMGVFTRFAAAGLIVMTLVIEFFAVSSFGDSLSNSDHSLWMMLLAVPFLYGPKALSVDYWLVKFLKSDSPQKPSTDQATAAAT